MAWKSASVTEKYIFRVDMFQGKEAARLHEMLCAWGEQAANLKSGAITKEDYDRWRYRYPEFDTTGHWHKVVPSQGLNDMLVEELNKDKKDK